MTIEFPIMWSYEDRRAAAKEQRTLRTSIPVALIAPHEAQANHNHGQTLKRLAERGGLSPCEAVAVLEDRRWHAMPDREADQRLSELIADWELSQRGIK